jgi:hypothetical protein
MNWETGHHLSADLGSSPAPPRPGGDLVGDRGRHLATTRCDSDGFFKKDRMPAAPVRKTLPWAGASNGANTTAYLAAT